jgi:deoxycytidylate deaminase
MGRVDRFIRLAANIALKSLMEFKHGAVLVKGGRVISTGYNTPRTCINGKDIPSLHAEIAVLQDRSITATKGADLFIVRLNTFGMGNSKPCLQCLETLKAFGVKRVFYTTPNGVRSEKVKDMVGYLRPYRRRDFDLSPPIHPHPH